MYNTNHIMWSLLTLITLFDVVQCHPISMQNIDKRDSSSEKRYSNGTVVGKYEYTDKDGNPVEVKYYADDTRYGVELNSVKIVPGNEDLHPSSLESKQVKIEKEFKSTDPVFGTIDDSFDAFKLPVSKKVYNTKKPAALSKETTKEQTLKTTHKSGTNSDYEIYMPNDFKSSKKCKDKVKVYNFEKQMRLIRNAVDDDGMPKFCEMY